MASGLGRQGGLAASLAVILSSIATLETTMLQFSRTLFAMGRDGAMPRLFGKVSAKTQSPTTAMYLLIGIGLVLLWGVEPDAQRQRHHHRLGQCGGDPGGLLLRLGGTGGGVELSPRRAGSRWLALWLFPGFSGLILIGLGVYAITTFNLITQIVGVGGFALGILFFRPGRYRATEQAALAE